MEANFQEVFPRYAYSVVSLRRIVWYLFTRHGGFVNTIVFITLMVGLALLILPSESIESASEELQLLLNRAIWIIVLSVSGICCFIYAKLILNFRLRLLYEQSQRCGKVLMLQLIVALLCLSALSMYSLVQQYQHVDSRVQDVELSSLWKMVFSIAAVARVLQRFLACIFICLALPVTKRWVCEMKPNIKTTLLELLPWKIFLFLHRNLLPPIFFEKPISSIEFYEDHVYVVSIVFRGFSLLWLLFVVLYVGYDFAIPCKCDSQAQGRKEIAGLGKVILDYPPKSNLVTGLSRKHYVLRYKGFPSTGGTERERKALMRSNVLVHERYRILFSQLD